MLLNACVPVGTCEKHQKLANAVLCTGKRLTAERGMWEPVLAWVPARAIIALLVVSEEWLALQRDGF
jgi:hypothetical protein